MSYFRNITQGAKELRTQLPVDAQLALMEVMDLLCEEPERGTNHEGTDFWIYKHPDPPLQVTYKLDRDEQRIDFLDFALIFMPISKDVFVSYSHDDLPWLEMIREKLAPLEEFGVKFWIDTDLEPGQVWDDVIKEQLGSAQAAFLLVTGSFLKSEYISEVELPRLLKAAKKGDLTLLWLEVSKSNHRKHPLGRKIGRFQALVPLDKPLDELPKKKRHRMLDKVLKRVAKAVSR